MSLEGDILHTSRRIDELSRSSRMLVEGYEEEGYGAMASLASVLRYDGETVATSENRSSTSFGNLATAGPLMDIKVGQTGRLLIIAAAQIGAPATGSGGATYGGTVGVKTTESFADGSTAEVIGAGSHPTFGMSVEAAIDGVDVVVGTSTEMLLQFEPLSTIEVRLQYKSVYGNSVSFDERSLIAIPV